MNLASEGFHRSRLYVPCFLVLYRYRFKIALFIQGGEVIAAGSKEGTVTRERSRSRDRSPIVRP